MFVWDTRRGEHLRAFAGHSGIIYAVAWGPSEELVISSGGNGKLRWWDIQSGDCLQVRDAHQGTIQSLRRSPDGTKLASCGNDGALCSGTCAPRSISKPYAGTGPTSGSISPELKV